MKLNLRAVDLDAIITDAGTQVREKLDEAWVSELMDLYRDGHEIDPVLVVIENIDGAEGRIWIADGFHRLEAQHRIGRTTVKATVRTGPTATLDFAKMLAAEANKNGRPLQPGDKRRAVLLARSTPEGRAMGVHELARHCGVTKGYVSKILDEGRGFQGNTVVVEQQCSPAPRPHIARLHARVDEALRADPSKPSTFIAKDLDCDVAMVRRRRAAIGIPIPSPTEQKASPSTKAVEAALRADPNRSTADISRETGATSTTIAKARERLNLPPRPRGPVPKDPPPSAPTRKGGDARDGAEIIQLRRPDPPKPDGPAYSSLTNRDIAAGVLRSFPDGDLALLAESIRQRFASRKEASS